MRYNTADESPELTARQLWARGERNRRNGHWEYVVSGSMPVPLIMQPCAVPALQYALQKDVR
jgi:hypothetical protein